ncbi:MAG: hypothetical protein ACR2FN_09520 [Chitinophagaceae bacterium]
MKLTATILIFFTTLNSFVCFNTLIFFSKQEAKTIIAQNAEDLKLIKIPLNKIAQFNDNEFWYDNQLYDVAKKQIVKDTLYAYLYHDKDEQNVLSIIACFFDANNTNVFTSPSGSSTLKIIHGTAFQQYIFYSNNFLLKYNLNNKKFFSKEIFFSITTIFDVPTPPPRIG